MPGFGTTSFGKTPFASGAAAPSTVTKPNLKPRAFGANKDFIWNTPNQDFERWPRTRQRVWLALSVKKGDLIALPDWGVTLPQKVTDTFDLDVKQAVNTALQPIKECLITDVIVNLTGSKLTVTVSYTDADTGLPGDLGVVYGS